MPMPPWPPLGDLVRMARALGRGSAIDAPRSVVGVLSEFAMDTPADSTLTMRSLMRGDSSSARFSRMAKSDRRKELAPVRTAIPCSMRKARIWLIVAVRRDTSRARTRCSACRSS